MYKWLRATGTGGETQTGSCIGVQLSVAPCLSEGKHPPRFPKRMNTQIHCEITINTSYSLSPQSGFVTKKQQQIVSHMKENSTMRTNIANAGEQTI